MLKEVVHFAVVVSDFKPIEMKKSKSTEMQVIDTEELQKKAPGYARPTSSARNTSPPNVSSMESEKQRLNFLKLFNSKILARKKVKS